jgi:hypothetical protein
MKPKNAKEKEQFNKAKKQLIKLVKESKDIYELKRILLAGGMAVIISPMLNSNKIKAR